MHGLSLPPFRISPLYFTKTVVLVEGVTQIGLSLRLPSVEPGAHAIVANVVRRSSEIRLNAQSAFDPELPPPPGVYES